MIHIYTYVCLHVYVCVYIFLFNIRKHKERYEQIYPPNYYKCYNGLVGRIIWTYLITTQLYISILFPVFVKIYYFNNEKKTIGVTKNGQNLLNNLSKKNIFWRF